MARVPVPPGPLIRQYRYFGRSSNRRPVEGFEIDAARLKLSRSLRDRLNREDLAEVEPLIQGAYDLVLAERSLDLEEWLIIEYMLVYAAAELDMYRALGYSDIDLEPELNQVRAVLEPAVYFQIIPSAKRRASIGRSARERQKRTIRIQAPVIVGSPKTEAYTSIVSGVAAAKAIEVILKNSPSFSSPALTDIQDRISALEDSDAERKAASSWEAACERAGRTISRSLRSWTQAFITTYGMLFSLLPPSHLCRAEINPLISADPDEVWAEVLSILNMSAARLGIKANG